MTSDGIIQSPSTGYYLREVIVDHQGRVRTVSTNATDLLKYLIRRTDITLLISNIRLALSTGRINPILRDTIQYLLDYTLGLVECRWDVEDLLSGPTRILQWLILSFGGNRTWNKFSQIIQRDVKTATRMVESRQVNPPYLDDLERMISNLQIYSNMLIGSIQYVRSGGPVLNGEEEELRGTRGHIPTTNQERLAFRVERALREVRKMRNDLVTINYFNQLEDWKDEHQFQSEEGVVADNDGLAPDSARYGGHQGDIGVSDDRIIGLAPLLSSNTSKDNFSRHSDPSKSIREDMKELSETLHEALKLQEKLMQQLRNGEDELETTIHPESSTQEPQGQKNSTLTKGKEPEGKSEIKCGAECLASIESTEMSAAEEKKNNDRCKPVLTGDTKLSMPTPGGASHSGSYVLFTPPSETAPTGKFRAVAEADKRCTARRKGESGWAGGWRLHMLAAWLTKWIGYHIV